MSQTAAGSPIWSGPWEAVLRSRLGVPPQPWPTLHRCAARSSGSTVPQCEGRAGICKQAKGERLPVLLSKTSKEQCCIVKLHPYLGHNTDQKLLEATQRSRIFSSSSCLCTFGRNVLYVLHTHSPLTPISLDARPGSGACAGKAVGRYCLPDAPTWAQELIHLCSFGHHKKQKISYRKHSC